MSSNEAVLEEKEGSLGWYPCPPPSVLPLSAAVLPTEPPKPSPDEICKSLDVKFVYSNVWSSISKAENERARRQFVKGVEIRPLPPGHFLHGQYGLFATQRFSKFDIIGEYTGKIVGCKVNGHYVAALEDNTHEASLGVDGEKFGNEMRFINSYLNIGFKANVSMRTAYVNSYPHILIVCTEDLCVDDELLLDYGEAYTSAYLTPKKITGTNITTEEMLNALPFGDESSDNEDESTATDNTNKNEKEA